MIAAIYARKSTEQTGVSDDEKSVARQIEHARHYAGRKGFTVRDEYTFSDDGVSGALFGPKRPGLARLLRALTPRPPFEVLLLSEESRLGRDQIETLNVLKQIIEAGVRVFVYLDDREVTLGDAVQTAMVQLRGFAAAAEREQASKRTHDALLRKARAGHVTGGRVYGYSNVDILGEPDQDGRRRRHHVVRAINEPQAAVVRRMFQMYAEGRGIKRIARALNAEHVPAPRATGWAPSAIREILHRELYHGVVVWNRSQKIVRRGAKQQRRRPEAQWLRVEAPELRIVPEELWEAVHRRLRSVGGVVRTDDGRLPAMVPRATRADGASPYLLTGFARCGRMKQ
jgi:DNA invertase Pin-like site-specific DNA recombinase